MGTGDSMWTDLTVTVTAMINGSAPHNTPAAVVVADPSQAAARLGASSGSNGANTRLRVADPPPPPRQPPYVRVCGGCGDTSRNGLSYGCDAGCCFQVPCLWPTCPVFQVVNTMQHVWGMIALIWYRCWDPIANHILNSDAASRFPRAVTGAWGMVGARTRPVALSRASQTRGTRSTWRSRGAISRRQWTVRACALCALCTLVTCAR